MVNDSISATTADKVLEVRGLGKVYGKGCPHCIDLTGPEHDTNICPRCGSVVAAHNVSFDLYRGEILGIIGESGSGKSTAVKALYFDVSIHAPRGEFGRGHTSSKSVYLPEGGGFNQRISDEAPTSGGSAVFYDQGKAYDLFALNAAQQRQLRNQRFGMVYQNPVLGLNFNVSAGGNIAERLLMSNLSHYGEIRRRATELLRRTEVLPQRMDELPKNFSGGMQQRVQIAKALATNPPLLLLDEVTTGLDLSVQAAILDLIMEIQQELGTAMIAVTHDLGVIRLLAGRTLVMKYGRVIESGLTDQILEDPQHAYTQRLVASAL